MTTFSVIASGSLTFTPPVWVWMKTWTPLACAAAQTGSKSRRVVRLRWHRREENRPEPAGGGALDLGHRLLDVGQGDGGGRRQPGEVRAEPLDDVVVVDAGVGHRQLVVVRVEAEERQVRVHDPDVHPVEVEVLEDQFGVTLGHPSPRLAVPRDRPAFEPRGVQAPELPCPTFDQWLDLEVVLPDPSLPQVLGQAGDEEVGGLEDVPVGGHDKGLVLHVLSLPCVFQRVASANCAKLLPRG